MTQSNTPSDRDRETDRRFRDLNRRVERLEYAQITPQELASGFDRLYDEIHDLEDHVNARFDQMSERIERLEGEVRELNRKFDQLDRKFDIVMQYITGQGGAS